MITFSNHCSKTILLPWEVIDATETHSMEKMASKSKNLPLYDFSISSLVYIIWLFVNSLIIYVVIK